MLDLVPQALSTRQSNQQQRQLQAHSGLMLGLFLDQKKTTGDAPKLAVLTNRAVAVSAERCRAPYLPKPGAARWHHPKFSSSQQWQQTPGMAENP